MLKIFSIYRSAFYFKKHIVFILRSINHANTDNGFIYEFIEPLPSFGTGGMLQDAVRVKCTNISVLESVLLQYCYTKFSRDEDCEERANDEWARHMLTRSTQSTENDVRIFSTYTFTQVDGLVGDWLPSLSEKLSVILAAYGQEEQQQGQALSQRSQRQHQTSSQQEQQPPALQISESDIIAVVDPLFYGQTVDTSQAVPFYNAVKEKYNIELLSRQIQEMIKKRLSILSRQPSEQELNTMVDDCYLAVNNKNEDIGTFIESIRAIANLDDDEGELTQETIKAIKTRVNKLRRGNNVRRLVVAGDNNLVEDGIFASPDDLKQALGTGFNESVGVLTRSKYCLSWFDISLHNSKLTNSVFSHLSIYSGLKTNIRRVGGCWIGDCYYEMLNDSGKLSTKQKFARRNNTEHEVQRIIIDDQSNITTETIVVNDEYLEELGVSKNSFVRGKLQPFYVMNNRVQADSKN